MLQPQRVRPAGLEQACSVCGLKRVWSVTRLRWRYGGKDYAPACPGSSEPLEVTVAKIADAIARRRAEDSYELMLAVKTVLRALEADAAALERQAFENRRRYHEFDDSARAARKLGARLDAWAGGKGLFRKP